MISPMRNIILLVLISLAYFVCACGASNPFIKRSSGKPEITVREDDPWKIIKALNSEMFSKNYYAKDIKPEKTIYAKRTGSFTQGLPYSPNFQTESELRVVFTLENSDRGTHILGTSKIILNPGDVAEQSTDHDQWETILEMQKVLERVKILVEKDRREKIGR